MVVGGNKNLECVVTLVYWFNYWLMEGEGTMMFVRLSRISIVLFVVLFLSKVSLFSMAREHPLLDAAKKGDHKKVCTLIDLVSQTKNKEAVKLYIYTRSRASGQTALHIASTGGHLEVVKPLVASLHELDKLNRTRDFDESLVYEYIFLEDNDGTTAYDVAFAHKKRVVGAYLKKIENGGQAGERGFHASWGGNVNWGNSGGYGGGSSGGGSGPISGGNGGGRYGGSVPGIIFS